MIVLFKSLSMSIDAYIKRPIQFILSTFTFLFFSLLTLFSLIGVLLIFFILMSVLKFADNVLPFAIMGAILLILFLYLFSGFKGALLKAFSTISDGARFSFMDFYKYAVKNGWNIFVISILNLILVSIIAAPVVYAFVSYFPEHPMPYVDLLLALIFLFAVFVIEFIFYPIYLAAALYGTDLVNSFKYGFQLITRKHIFFLGIFIIYCLGLFTIVLPLLLAYAVFTLYNFVWGFLFVPILVIVPIFVILPIVCNSLVLFFQNYIGKSR